MFLAPLQGQSLTETSFDMYFYENREFFSASVNNLDWKPLLLHFQIIQRSQKTKKNQNIKEELEAKYQRVTDSKSKIKSAVWRVID